MWVAGYGVHHVSLRVGAGRKVAGLGRGHWELGVDTISMMADEDSPWGLLFSSDLSFSHTLYVLKEKRRRCEHCHLRENDSSVPEGWMKS